uniref:Uncharacterized protein n=1 Tax=Rhizophora mucronata TaxID=61149 RepID=A0A2P2Q0M5_RHIMU
MSLLVMARFLINNQTKKMKNAKAITARHGMAGRNGHLGKQRAQSKPPTAG